MKKSIFAVALILGATSTTFAQEEKQYTPVSGDWAIGIDATPFLNYVGNLIGGNDGNVSPTWTYLTTNQQITGKYFASDDLAYRGSLRIGFGSGTQRAMIGQEGAAAPTFPNLPATVEDTYKSGSSNIGLSGGLEWRKGSGRLIGFYGGELGVSFSSSSETYTYGNGYAAGGVATTDFGTNLAGDPVWGGGRKNSSKSGMTTAFGLRGFIGAEYFVLPKMSIGGEFGWGFGLMSVGASTETWITDDGTATAEIEHVGTKSSGFGLDTDINNTLFGAAGSLRLTFHF